MLYSFLRALASGRGAAQAAPAPHGVFLSPAALAINKARLDHLESLRLDLAGKRVLEVGAGIGLHTPFFRARDCEVVVSDGNRDNVAEIRRRHPTLRVEHLDLEGHAELRDLGSFDIVHCYGLLYHLGDPERALRRLSAACTGQILVETMVALGRFAEVHRLRDFPDNPNQAVSGIGCRPTRRWMLDTLRAFFGHAYVSRTQPDHPDFPLDWELPETRLVYRAVFVGSRTPLHNPELLTELPMSQLRCEAEEAR